MVELCSEVVVNLVGVALLNHSHSTMSLAIAIIYIAHLVILNDAVEVDIAVPVAGVLDKLSTVGLDVGLSKLQRITICLGKVVEHQATTQAVAIVRRQHAVVVGAWILTLIPGKCRVAIKAKAHRGSHR